MSKNRMEMLGPNKITPVPGKGIDIVQSFDFSAGDGDEYNYKQWVTTDNPKDGKQANKEYFDQGKEARGTKYSLTQGFANDNARIGGHSATFTDQISRSDGPMKMYWNARTDVIRIGTDGTETEVRTFTYGFRRDSSGQISVIPVRIVR